MQMSQVLSDNDETCKNCLYLCRPYFYLTNNIVLLNILPFFPFIFNACIFFLQCEIWVFELIHSPDDAFFSFHFRYLFF